LDIPRTLVHGGTTAPSSGASSEEGEGEDPYPSAEGTAGRRTSAAPIGIQELARRRRRLVLKKFFQTVDTALPTIRLGLLLSCWASSSSSSSSPTAAAGVPSPDLALLLSGLRYTAVVDDPGPPGGPPPSQPTSASASASSPSSSLFVLYGHRRWLQQECLDLWPAVVGPLLATVSETAGMVGEIWAGMIPRWGRGGGPPASSRRGLQDQRRRLAPDGGGSGSGGGSHPEREGKDERGPCPLCGTDAVAVPYRIRPCRHSACYTCLWDHVRTDLQRKQKQQQKQQQRQQRRPKQSASLGSVDAAPSDGSVPEPALLLADCPVCCQPIEGCEPA
jgi:hypothetical protein